MASRVADILWTFRWWLTSGVVLGGLFLAPRADFTKIDNDITAWFSKADPIYREYDRFREEFGGTRTLIVALDVAPDAADARAGVFTEERLRFIDEVSDELERVRTVEHVNSLGTATLVTATPRGEGDDDGGLRVEPLIPDEVRLKPDRIRERALNDALIRGDLVSEDGRTAAILVSFDEDRIDEVRGAVLEEIRAVVERRLPIGLRAHFNGSIEISDSYNRITLDNQRTFIPPIFALTFGAIYLMFRSIRRTVLTMVAVSLSIVWTLGLYSLLGFTYNVLSSMIVPLIVVLAIADDVHIMQHFEHVRRKVNPEQAFKRTIRHLLAPLLGASGTTALGMLSLATSSVVAVRQFGIGSAVGIMVDFALSIVFMPTLLAWMKPETIVAPHEAWLVRPMRAIARFSSGRPRRVLAISLAILIAAIAGIPRLRVDTNHINFFAEDHPLGSSARVIDGKLAGVYSFQFFLEGPPDSMKTPEALRRMDRLAGELSQLPFVRKVTTPAEYVKRINRELHGGVPTAAVVPADANLIAQELFLFTMSDDGRTELERMVSSDFSKAQVSVKFMSMSSDVLYDEIARAEAIARNIFAGSGIQPTATGSGKLFSALDHYLVVSQLSSFATAFVTVFGVIFLVFRSTRFGLLAIVPNLFPVIAVLGLMGWLDISLNIATIMVASVALGIVDDDTIHFINRFRRETAGGASIDDAIETATVLEGRASLTTAFINTCAYATVMLSAYKPTAWFGGLLAATIAVAFLAEVFVLPATIKLVPRLFAPRITEAKEGTEIDHHGDTELTETKTGT
jgi:uncharacterized protein